MRGSRLALIAVAMAAAAACAGTTVPSSVPSALPSPSPSSVPNPPSSDVLLYPLPADASLTLGPGATPLACAGIGTDAILRGSATDQRVVWLEDAASGRRMELVWPPGYTARFVPKLEVLDQRGNVVAREGHSVIGVCVTGADNTFWLPTP